MPANMPRIVTLREMVDTSLLRNADSGGRRVSGSKRHAVVGAGSTPRRRGGGEDCWEVAAVCVMAGASADALLSMPRSAADMEQMRESDSDGDARRCDACLLRKRRAGEHGASRGVAHATQHRCHTFERASSY